MLVLFLKLWGGFRLSPGLLLVLLVAIPQFFQSSSQASLLDLALDLPSPFGFGGPLLLTFVPASPSHLQAERGIIPGSVPTCMGVQRILQALNSLIEAVLSLAREVRSLQAPEPIARQPSEVPGAPTDFDPTIRFEVESGVPPTLDFLVQFAQKLRRRD